MANKNTDFLRFSSYSIKDLITRKLSENSNFTDQVYEGSNLNVLIDICSYLYQCLLYVLNKSAAESMFSDTQIYENITRLVNMIGYNPKGCIASTCRFTFNNVKEEDSGIIIKDYYGKCIPPYSAIDTDLSDGDGNKIYYSTVEPYYINNDAQYSIMMVNGRWEMYNQVLVSDGTDYQTFILDGLQSDAENKKYVMWPYIDVYVRHYNNNTGKYTCVKWQRVTDGLFTDNELSNGAKIYTANDRIYNIRLREDKTYEIKFGNGVNGAKPVDGDELIVFYLKGNGAAAKIESPNSISNKYLNHSASFFGIAGDLYEKIFADYLNTMLDQDEINECPWTNTTQTTDFKEEESVEEIRENAPNWFKSGNRLITQDDYVYYLKQRYKDNIVDICSMNNWEYISTFYKWLYDLGRNHRNNGKYYLNENNLIKYDYKYADACDSNNVYLWVKMKNDIDIYNEAFKKEIANIKTMTAETVFVKPVDVNFMLSARDADELKQIMKDSNAIRDQQSYLEVLLSNSTLYTNDIVSQKISNIIVEFFKDDNFNLGDKVDYNDLLNQIYEIEGIDRVRTICEFTDDDGYTKYKILNGISFATWSNTLIRDGDDMEVSNTTRILQPFQFPVLFENSDEIKAKIKVIKKNTNMVNAVQY